MPGCLTVDLAAQTITPQLQLDKRSHTETKDGFQYLKFVTWSTHPVHHPTQTRTVHFANSTCATLTFNLETTSPLFAISSARSSAPRHPLLKVSDVMRRCSLSGRPSAHASIHPYIRTEIHGGTLGTSVQRSPW